MPKPKHSSDSALGDAVGDAVGDALGDALGDAVGDATTTSTKLLDAVTLDALIARWWHLRSRMHGFFASYDVILAPVNAGPAFAHGGLAEPGAIEAFSYTVTYTLTGWPGAVVRGGTSPEGLPIGVQIVAPPWREDVALAVAGFLESELGGFASPAL